MPAVEAGTRRTLPRALVVAGGSPPCTPWETRQRARSRGSDRARGSRSRRPSTSSSATRCAPSRASASRRSPRSSTASRGSRTSSSAELAELGLMGLPVPERFGGAGADTLSYALAVEELTRIDSSVAITMAAHVSLGTMPILLFGSTRSASAGFPTSRAAGAWPRSASPSPTPARMQVRRARRAELADGSWVVNGSKIFITNAGTPRTWGVTITALHRRGRDLQHRRRERDARVRDLRADPQDGLEGVRHAGARVRRLRRAGGEPARRARDRGSRSSCRSSTVGGSRSPRWASASRRAPTTSRPPTRASASSSAGRSGASRRSRSSSPTWRSRSRRGASSCTRPPG